MASNASSASTRAAGDGIGLGAESTEQQEPTGVGKKRGREGENLGPASAALGRIPGPKGTIVSARLQAAKEAAADIAGEIASGLPDDVVTGIVGEIKAALEKPGGFRKYRGGGKAEMIADLKKYVKNFVDYASTEGAPIVAPAMSLARGTVGLTQEIVIRVPVTIAALTISGTALSANFFKNLIAKFNAWGRSTSEILSSDITAEEAAAAAVRDIPSIAKTSAVTIVFFNQLGLLPISAVLAAILFAVRANISTGPARSLLISQFYTWYIMKPKEEQEAFIKAAKEYATATADKTRGALDKSSPAVVAVAKGVGEFMARAGVGAASAASSLVPGSSSSSSSSSAAAAAAPLITAPPKSAESILTEGAPAASVVAGAAENIATEDATKEGKSNEAAPALEAAVKAATEDTSTGRVLRRRPLGISPGSSSSSSPATSPRSTASSAPFAIGQPSPNTEAKRRKKKEGGKRRTVRKPKRRVTRRKAKMPTFVY